MDASFNRIDFDRAMYSFSCHASQIMVLLDEVKLRKQRYNAFESYILFLAVNSTTDSDRQHYLTWFVMMAFYVLGQLDSIRAHKCTTESTISSISDFNHKLQQLIFQLDRHEAINADSLDSCVEYAPLLNQIDKLVEVINCDVAKMSKTIKSSLIASPHVIVHTILLNKEVIEICGAGSTAGVVITRSDITAFVAKSSDFIDQILKSPFRIPSPLYAPDMTFQLLSRRLDLQENSLVESHQIAVELFEKSVREISTARREMVILLKSDQQKTCTKNGNDENLIPISSSSCCFMQRVFSEDTNFLENVKLLAKEVSIFEACGKLIVLQEAQDMMPLLLDADGNDCSGANNHGYNDWTAVDIWHEKGRIAQRLFDEFSCKWRRVYSLIMSTDYPEELPTDEFNSYNCDLDWYRDHLRYLKSHVDFEPYKSATRDGAEQISCHPQLGPWTGPYRELLDTSINSQYGKIYDAVFEQIQLLTKKGQKMTFHDDDNNNDSSSW